MQKEGEANFAVADLIRKHGVSHNTYFGWKAKYRGESVTDFMRRKELEQESAKLKRMYALALESAAIKDDVGRESQSRPRSAWPSDSPPPSTACR